MFCFIIGLLIAFALVGGCIKIISELGAGFLIGILSILITLICILFKVAFWIVIGILLFKLIVWIL